MIRTAEFTRDIASILVKDAELKTGSRMAAYETVGQKVGMSGSWLRKFIKGQEAKEPGWTTGWKILDLYSRFCDRVEAEVETERAKTLALKRQIDAITEAFNRTVEREAATEGGSPSSPNADRNASSSQIADVIR